MGELMRKAQQHIQAEKEMALNRAEMGVVGTNRELHNDDEVARRNKGDKGGGKKTARQLSPPAPRRYSPVRPPRPSQILVL